MADRIPFDAACRANLIALAETYCAATGLSLATVSHKIHGQGKFLAQYKAGKCSVTASKMSEMLERLGRDWPRGTPWPSLPVIRMSKPGRKIPVDDALSA